MVRSPNPQLADQWQRRIRRFDNADTTVAQFGRQEQCSVASFYQWRLVYTQPTDMRKSFNGLSGIVAQHFEVDLFSGHLFVFFNRKRDFVKILMWDQDGLSLWSKRLESGTFEKFSRNTVTVHRQRYSTESCSDCAVVIRLAQSSNPIMAHVLRASVGRGPSARASTKPTKSAKKKCPSPRTNQPQRRQQWTDAMSGLDDSVSEKPRKRDSRAKRSNSQ